MGKMLPVHEWPEDVARAVKGVTYYEDGTVKGCLPRS
jgi:hypothetical protein